MRRGDHFYAEMLAQSRAGRRLNLGRRHPLAPQLPRHEARHAPESGPEVEQVSDLVERTESPERDISDGAPDLPT